MIRKSTKTRGLTFFLAIIITIFTGLLPNGFFSSKTARAAGGDVFTAIDANGASIDYTVGMGNEISGGYNITAGGVYEVTGSVTTGTGNIVVNTADPVVLILNGAERESTQGNNGDSGVSTLGGSPTNSPIQLRSDANVTIVLLDGKTNTFICNGTATPKNTIQAGIYVPSGANLTIRGQADNTGKLIATSGSFSPGIGGGVNSNAGNIKIEGGIIIATAKAHSGGNSGNGAGIGGGGGHTSIGGNSGNITICGQAVVTAVSQGNGAGIGGGAGNSAGNGETIFIRGNANVTATSNGSGAGIGGGGASTHSTTNSAGAGGTISISGHSTVDATSKGNGAGIGGGGVASGANPAGTGNNIIIFEDANVTATSNGNGAGIGGGGALSGNAGASGSISINDNPTIVAHSDNANAVDIGPGTNASNALGIPGSITIVGGNVYAPKTDASTTTVVTNGANGGDSLIMLKIVDDPHKLLTYILQGSLQTYSYAAITNASGEAYLWLRPGQQLIVCKDESNNVIQSDTVLLASKPNNIITIPSIAGYTVDSVDPSAIWDGVTTLTVQWNGVSPLDVIVIYYKSDTITLKLEAHDLSTVAPILDSLNNPISYTVASALININKNYNYSSDIAALTAKVEAEHPGKYIELPQGTSLYFIDQSNNTVIVFYASKPTNSVLVEARIGSTTGVLIANYSIPAEPGETIALNSSHALNLSALGFAVDISKSVLTAKEGTANKIIFVYSNQSSDGGTGSGGAGGSNTEDNNSTTTMPPKTGDVSNLRVLLMLALASLCGIVAIALYRKKIRA